MLNKFFNDTFETSHPISRFHPVLRIIWEGMITKDNIHIKCNILKLIYTKNKVAKLQIFNIVTLLKHIIMIKINSV